MKILFINPLDKANCTHFVVQPLGLMYISAFLREHSNHDVKILDMKVNFMSEDDALKEVKKFSPDVIGIRALSVESASAHLIAKMVKRDLPNCKVIVGGPYTDGSSNHILKDANVDFVVVGEGEETVCELITEIEKGNEFPDTHGIGYRQNGEPVFTHSRRLIEDLDTIPLPAWDLIDVESYFKVPSWNFHISRHMALFTSRGCPYKCAYCHNIFGKKPRMRSPENVLKEIEILYNQYGVRELKIIDDIFNVRRSRAQQICDLIVERGFKVDICFPNGLRGDIMDRTTLQKLRAAGTFEITYAVETASPRLQRLIKKNINLPKLKQVIEDTVEMGIFTRGFFMMGFPSETREEIHDTASFSLSSKLHWMSMFIVNPFEGTEIADMAKEMNIDIDHDKLDFSGGYRVNPVQLSHMPVQEIKALQFKTLRKFFLNPVRLYSIYKCSHDKKQKILFVFTMILKAILPASKRDKWIRKLFTVIYYLGRGK
ncbi:Fe-S oxidoreductase [Candidatus Scalindua japonica]|uniref:Fe-S oxidoreductase n=1 Tax=Candidatus Scalindua japonica TaxID=1284222 RepID=A0A286TX18_9BACT|nr:radical SAM protein [Candidatus Scalindua japonica]GAX60415.1 Fe-S oxidoreductase [Candidatus Scalindua japonica]